MLHRALGAGGEKSDVTLTSEHSRKTLCVYPSKHARYLASAPPLPVVPGQLARQSEPNGLGGINDDNETELPHLQGKAAQRARENCGLKAPGRRDHSLHHIQGKQARLWLLPT